MTKSKVTDWDATRANNTDVGGIDIRGSANVRNHDDGMREIMAQIAKVNAGTDAVADTMAFGDPANLTKRVRLDAGNVTAGQTRVLAMPDQDVTITAMAASILDDADAAAVRATIGAGAATDVANSVQYVAQTLDDAQKGQAQSNLGLLHTNANFQNLIDATLRDGLKLDTVQSAGVTDPNTIVRFGLRGVSNTASNVPEAKFGLLLTLPWDSGQIKQYWASFQAADGDVTYRRFLRLGGVWSPWEPLVEGQTALDARYARVANSNVFTARQEFRGGNAPSGGFATTTAFLGQMEVRGDANGAFIAFNRGAAYGSYLGVTPANELAYGGWSAGAVANVVHHDGNAAKESGQFTITATGSITWAHGLGTVPKCVDFRLECVTAEAGYSAGEVLDQGFYAGSTFHHIAATTVDATNVGVRFTNGSPTIGVFHKTTGVGTSVTPANWRLRIVVRR